MSVIDQEHPKGLTPQEILNQTKYKDEKGVLKHRPQFFPD